MKTMKFAVALLCATVASGAEIVDRVVARINDSIVSQDELAARIERARKDPSAPTDFRKLEIQVLEQMIRQRLIDDRAAALDLTVSNEEVDEALARVKQQYGLKSDADFDRALEASGLTRDILRDQLRQTILANKVLSREVPVSLTDDALRTEYEKTKDKLYAIAEKAHVLEIAVPFDPRDSASRTAAESRVEEAARRVASGTPFPDVARQYSEGPARQRGGDIGVVSRGELQGALDTAIFGGGDLSKPVEAGDAFYLLQVTSREKATFRPFDDVKEDIRKKMSEDIYDKKFSEYLRNLRDASFVKIFDPDLAALDAEAWKQATSSNP